MRARPWAAAAALALLAGPAAGAESLLEIYRLAQRHDAALQAAEARWRAAAQAEPIARAALLPQLSYEFDVSEAREVLHGSRFGRQSAAIAERGTTRRDSLSLTQTLYRHDLYVQLRRARSVAARARAARDAARQALIVRAAEAYFDVLAARDGARFARQEQAAIGHRQEQAEARFRVGLASLVEVKGTQASADLAAARAIDAENLLANRREALSVITGKRHPALAALAARMELQPPEPAAPERWVAAALERNLDYLIRQHDLAVAARDLEAERAQHYPTLDAYASSGKNDRTGGVFGGSRLHTDRFGVRLQVPLLAGGRAVHRTQQAAHRHEAAKAELRGERRRTEQRARSAYLDVQAGIARVRAYQRALESARVELEANQVGLEAGSRDLVNVVTATSRLYAAERDLAQARYRHLLDTLRLRRAAGSLADADLARIDRWLD